MESRREGRDVYVSGVDSIDSVKEIFADAFTLRADQMFVEGQPQDDYLRALGRGSVISVYELDRRGTFRFKVEMEFSSTIDPINFLYAALAYGVAIAYAVDENRRDFDYHVATRDGVIARQLSFIDVDDSYICNAV